MTLNYTVRWADGTRTVEKLVTDNDPNYAPKAQLRYRELWQHDLQVGYEVTDGMSFYLGVLNLSNQRPDPGNSINQPISAVGPVLLWRHKDKKPDLIDGTTPMPCPALVLSDHVAGLAAGC